MVPLPPTSTFPGGELATMVICTERFLDEIHRMEVTGSRGVSCLFAPGRRAR